METIINRMQNTYSKSGLVLDISGQKLRETGRDIIRDKSRHMNHGMCINETNIIQTKEGICALSFDGVNDYVEVPHFDEFPREDVTVEFWLYQRAYGDAASYINKRTNGNDGLMFFMFIDHKLFFDWGNGNSNHRWDCGYIPPLKEWVHITITRDVNGRYLYVNGNLFSFTTNPGGPIPEANTSKIMLMRDSMGSQHYVNGLIDEVRIYNRALSAEEVRGNMFTSKRYRYMRGV